MVVWLRKMDENLILLERLVSNRMYIIIIVARIYNHLVNSNNNIKYSIDYILTIRIEMILLGILIYLKQFITSQFACRLDIMILPPNPTINLIKIFSIYTFHTISIFEFTLRQPIWWGSTNHMVTVVNVFETDFTCFLWVYSTNFPTLLFIVRCWTRS